MRLAWILAALGLAAGARAETSGAIFGTIVDGASGIPLAGAEVTASGPSLQGERTARTDDSGAFELPQLPPGAYTLDVRRDGYAPFSEEAVAVHLGDPTRLRLPMLHEVGAAALGRPEAPALLLPVVTQGQMQLVPYGREVRSFDQAALAVPGLLPGLRAPGASPSGTRVSVDGADVTDPLSRGLGTHLLQNFVEEVAVRTAPFSAEYGLASGALVSAVTKSGGDEVHGSAFADALGDPRALEGGFELGGPIARDRLWFYGGFAPEAIDGRGTDFQYVGKLTARPADDQSIALSAFGDPGENRSGASDFSLRYLGRAGPALIDAGAGLHHSLDGEDRLQGDASVGGVVSLAGRHDLKVGGEFAREAAAGSTQTLAAGFAQDGWSIGDRLFLDAGARWEGQRGASAVLPRVSAAYDFLGGGRSKVYAAYGRFEEPLALAAPASLAIDDVFSGGVQAQLDRDLAAGIDYTRRPLYDGVTATIAKPLSQNYLLQLSWTHAWWSVATDIVKLDAAYAYEWTPRSTLTLGTALRAIRGAGWQTDLAARGAFVYELSSAVHLAVNLDVLDNPATARAGATLSF